MKSLNNFFERFNGYLERSIRFFGPFLVAIGLVMISLVVYVHFQNSIPYYGNYSSLYGLIHLCVSFFLLTNVISNYLLVVFTNPGKPPSFEELHFNEQQIDAMKSGEIVKDRECDFRFCKVCCYPKPERTRHCKVCNRCVLKFDHHCPWIANCVGLKNHKYFLSFLIYMWIGCTYFLAMAYIPFTASLDFSTFFAGHVPRSFAVFSFAITFCTLIGMSLMLLWQGALVFTGQTMVEFYSKNVSNIPQNSYNLGVIKNLNEFFGISKSRFWFLPSRWNYSPLDGVYWKSKRIS